MDISQINQEHIDTIMLGIFLLIFIVISVALMAIGSSSSGNSTVSNKASNTIEFPKTTDLVQIAGPQTLSGKRVSDIEVIPHPQAKVSQVAQLITIKFTDGTMLKIDGIPLVKLEAAVRWNIIKPTHEQPLKL